MPLLWVINTVNILFVHSNIFATLLLPTFCYLTFGLFYKAVSTARPFGVVPLIKRYKYTLEATWLHTTYYQQKQGILIMENPNCDVLAKYIANWLESMTLFIIFDRQMAPSLINVLMWIFSSILTLRVQIMFWNLTLRFSYINFWWSIAKMR